MRALVFVVVLAGCTQSVDPDGIYQYTMKGDIQPSRGGYCLAGMIDEAAQVQIVGSEGSMGADASTNCNAPSGGGCDSIPCGHTIGFHCTFESDGNVSCTPSIDGGTPITSVFALGTCTSSTCSITSPPINDTYTNIDIEMVRQR